MGIRKNWKIRS